MSWNDLTNDRTVSWNNLVGSSFSLKNGGALPSSQECLTRTEANALNILAIANDNKLVRKSELLVNNQGPTAPAPDCPSRTLVFQVCNSNSSKDDNFDVFLNDVFIGRLDLSLNAQVGSVFIASLGAPDLSEPDFVCPMDLIVAYYFDPALVYGGTNTIKMINTGRNNNGNYGKIGVRNYLQSGSNLASPCLVADLDYSGETGANFSLSFNYEKCCDSDLATTEYNELIAEVTGSYRVRVTAQYAVRANIIVEVTIQYRSGINQLARITLHNGSTTAEWHNSGTYSDPIYDVFISNVTPEDDGTYYYGLRPAVV